MRQFIRNQTCQILIGLLQTHRICVIWRYRSVKRVDVDVIKEVKTKDAVKVDELTEEDVNKAYNALYEKLFDVMNDIYPGFLEQYTDVNM